LHSPDWAAREQGRHGDLPLQMFGCVAVGWVVHDQGRHRDLPLQIVGRTSLRPVL